MADIVDSGRWYVGEGEDGLHAMSTWSGYKRVGDPLWATGLKGQTVT